MKISIDAGHNCTPDVGAKGFKQEDVLTKEVTAKIIKRLQNTNNAVLDCTPYKQIFLNLEQSLKYRCSKANQFNSDVHLCIHFNAGGGEGVECYATSQTGKNYAGKICKEIATLGYVNRGVKDGSHLYVVNNTTMPCVLVECSFVDSARDMNAYNADSLANAIVNAVVLDIKSIPPIRNSGLNSVVLSFQNICNLLGITDKNGNKLAEDGFIGDATNSAIAKVIIKEGANNILVKWLQTRLITLGFSCGSSGADGYFGYYTLTAVKRFQTKYNLKMDGIVGTNTINKLF